MRIVKNRTFGNCSGPTYFALITVLQEKQEALFETYEKVLPNMLEQIMTFEKKIAVSTDLNIFRLS